MSVKIKILKNSYYLKKGLKNSKIVTILLRNLKLNIKLKYNKDGVQNCKWAKLFQWILNTYKRNNKMDYQIAVGTIPIKT